jgi:hypothetical protein
VTFKQAAFSVWNFSVEKYMPYLGSEQGTIISPTVIMLSTVDNMPLSSEKKLGKYTLLGL